MAEKRIRRDGVSHPKRQTAATKKRTIVLSAEEDKALTLFCVAEELRPGVVIGTLIRTHLKGYVLQKRGDTEGWDKEGEGSKLKLA